MNGNRNFVCLTLLFVCASLLFAACSSMPRWYLNPPKSNDKFYGVGVSENISSIQLGRDTAVANARNDLAQKIQVNVQGMIRTFLQQSGTMEESRAMSFAESVGKQVVNVTLTGSEVSQVEVRDGNYYALVEISMDSIKNALSTAARNAAAEYSELKARNALQDLDKAIQQMNAQ